MIAKTERYYKRDFWAVENQKYSRPHFRLIKEAWLINKLARGKICDFLDVGCGPATLERLLSNNIHYYGIDIALSSKATNLQEMDFLSETIHFDDRQFDIVAATGVFEYVGRHQAEKLLEIRQLLRKHGVFVVSYVNFDHICPLLYEPYSNIQSFGEFCGALSRVFHIERRIPTSYHWYHREPSRGWLRRIEMRMNANLPLLGRLFAVEYFVVCRAG